MSVAAKRINAGRTCTSHESSGSVTNDRTIHNADRRETERDYLEAIEVHTKPSKQTNYECELQSIWLGAFSYLSVGRDWAENDFV